MNSQSNSINAGSSNYHALYLNDHRVIINTTISSVSSVGDVRLQIVANVSRQLAKENKEHRVASRLLPVFKQPLKPRKLFGPSSRESIQGYLDNHANAKAFLEMVEGVTRQLNDQNRKNEQK